MKCNLFLDKDLPAVAKTCPAKQLTPKHTCTMCDHQLSSAAELESHILSHARGIKHRCTICDVTFTSCNDSESHALTHSHVTFLCTVCSGLFSDQSEVDEHRSVHKHEQYIEVYHCIKCGKKFKEHGLLKKHLCAHILSELQYSCLQCEQVFISQENFLEHYRGHNDLGNDSSDATIEEVEILSPTVPKKVKRGKHCICV